MFYRTSEDHGFEHDPFKALIAPRPIAWISSQDKSGRVNLAPYSFFNGVGSRPPQIMFASNGTHRDGGLKDTVKNIKETGEFVVNLVTWELREEMNASSVDAPRDVNEFEYAGLTPCDSKLVQAPGVQESPVRLECESIRFVELASEDPENPTIVVFGNVLGISIANWAISDGKVDTVKLNLIARLGYYEYARITQTYTLLRPKWEQDK